MEAPLVQSTFLLPPEILAGLNSNDLVRFGGVVRNRGGEIVIHLDEVELPDPDLEGAKRLATKLRKPRVIVPILLVAGVLSRFAFAVARKRRRRVDPQCIERYNLSLRAYLVAVKGGHLDVAIIKALLSDLAAVQSFDADSEHPVNLDFSSEQVTVLVQIVADYTEQLASENAIDVDEFRSTASQTDNEPGGALRSQLELQHRLLESAA